MKKPIVAFSLAISFIAVLVAVFFARLGVGRKKNQPAILGSVARITGELTSRKPLTENFATVRMGATIEAGELFRTFRAAEAEFEFVGGTRLRLGENARFVAENDSLRRQVLRLTLLEGQAQLLAAAKPDALLIFHNGVALNPARFNELPLAIGNVEREQITLQEQRLTAHRKQAPVAIVQPLPGPLVASDLSPPQPVKPTGNRSNLALDLESLSAEEIRDKLKAQQSFMQRCYLNYLHQQKPVEAGAFSIRGRVVVGFDIEANGHVTKSQIVRSDFSDEVLKRCVREVVDRTEFRPFAGNKIQVVEFPISLQF